MECRVVSKSEKYPLSADTRRRQSETKLSWFFFRTFVAGRSFRQPGASSSLRTNAEADGVNFCVSSELDLPQLDLCLNSSLIHLPPASEARGRSWSSSEVNQQVNQHWTAKRNYWKGIFSLALSGLPDKRISGNQWSLNSRLSTCCPANFNVAALCTHHPS